MSTPELTEALRDIDTTAAKARRAYGRANEPRVILQYLLAIQQRAQTAMPEVQAAAEGRASLFCACTRLLAKHDHGTGPSDEELLDGIRAAVAKAVRPTTPDAPGKGENDGVHG